MKKHFTSKLLILIIAVLVSVCALVACGRVEFKVDFVVDGAVYATINTNGEEIIKMPTDPVKEDYVFDGWYWDKDSWQRPFTANSLLDAPLSSNMSVYAKWTNEESVTGVQAVFNGFEKTGDYEYTLKVPNATKTLSLEPLVIINSKSVWSLSFDIEGNQTIASRTAELAVGNNTYYALVTADTSATQLYTLRIRRRPIYNVIFDADGGKAVEAQRVEEDSFAVEPATTKVGYDFVEWNYDFANPITDNKIIVASWKAREYTINYDAKGGDVENRTTKVIYDKTYELEDATRRGYTFKGWLYNGEVFEDGTWRLTNDITLEATWEINTYNIEYDLDGGKVDGVNPAEYTVESDSITLVNPTRNGYTFTGWTGTDISHPTMSVIILNNSIVVKAMCNSTLQI